MPARKKKAAKKASPQKEGKPIPVYSKPFLEMLHQDEFKLSAEFQVSCNVDGVLDSGLPGGTFPTLDTANDFAAAHRKVNPGHRLTVSTTQS